MSSPPTCPSCGTPLGLFTPREISAHVNGCLDAKATEAPQSARPSCAVCNRDLSLLTPAARQEHANRCADTLLPLSVTEAHPPRRRARAVSCRPAPARADERVARLLQLLGLARYAARFAGEEIDLDALILLDDADYAQLRIPDAARRRIADALHNVPLLAELRGDDPPGALSATQTQPPPVPTQRFGRSNLETRLQRGRGLLDDESSADEFPHVREQEAVDKFAGAAGSKGEEDGRESPVVVHSLSPEDGNLNREECEKPDAERHLETPEESVAIHGQDASELLLKSTDEDSEAVSSLSNFEKDLPLTSQISSQVKLEKWRQRELQRERERHEKALNDIKMKYECMKRKLEHQHAVNGAASTVTANGKVSDSTHSSPIDLTKSVEKGDPAPSTISPRIHVHDNESILISSGSGQGHNSDASAEDSLLIPDPVESPARSKAASVDGSRASPPAESDSEIMDLTCASTEKLKRSRVYGEDSSSELVEERPTATFTQRRALPSMFADDEEEEAVTIDVTEEKAPAVAVESSALDVSEAQEEPSRLKKRRRKVTRAEIIAGIKLDAALYDDMLSMEMVSFARIAASLKESGLVVSKKALGDFLHSEGAAFKV